MAIPNGDISSQSRPTLFGGAGTEAEESYRTTLDGLRWLPPQIWERIDEAHQTLMRESFDCGIATMLGGPLPDLDPATLDEMIAGAAGWLARLLLLREKARR
jgi:hypothetical protein